MANGHKNDDNAQKDDRDAPISIQPLALSSSALDGVIALYNAVHRLQVGRGRGQRRRADSPPCELSRLQGGGGAGA